MKGYQLLKWKISVWSASSKAWMYFTTFVRMVRIFFKIMRLESDEDWIIIWRGQLRMAFR